VTISEHVHVHVFYVAGARIVNVTKFGQYKLWLLDYTNETKISDWRNGKPIPDAECITIEYSSTFESNPANPDVHILDDDTLAKLQRDLKKRIQPDLWSDAFSTEITVAVSQNLWSKISPANHPLPPHPHREPYRIQVLARKFDSGSTAYFMGFHVEVIVPGQHPVLRFFNAVNRNVGADEVDLSSTDFEPAGAYTTISASSKKGDSGALFVSLDAMSTTLPFLRGEGPKVPFGAGGNFARNPAIRNVQSALHATAEVSNSPPVVVISNTSDSWLKAARDEVDGEGHAVNKKDVINEIKRLLKQFPERDAVELVSHSNSDNLLRIGSWVLDQNAFLNSDEEFRDLVKGKEIRILGCATATGEAANKTLLAMQKKLNVAARGTRGLVGTVDLSAEGSDPARRASLFVAPSETAEDADSRISVTELLRGGPPVKIEPAQHEALVAGLTSESRLVAREILRLVGDGRAYSYPGLLRLPSATIPLHDESGAPVGRIDALFRGQLIRFTWDETSTQPRREYLFLVEDEGTREQLQGLFRGWK
jgi:hypothetical protein